MISTAVQDQEREVVHIGECRNKGEGWQEMVRLLVRLHEGEEEVASERAPVQQQEDKNVDKTSFEILCKQICVYIFGCLIWPRVAVKYTILSPACTLVRK